VQAAVLLVKRGDDWKALLLVKRGEHF